MKIQLLLLGLISVFIMGCHSLKPSRSSLEQFFSNVTQESKEGKSWAGDCWSDNSTIIIHTGNKTIAVTKEEMASSKYQKKPAFIEGISIVDDKWEPETKTSIVTVDHLYKTAASSRGIYTIKNVDGKLKIIKFENMITIKVHGAGDSTDDSSHGK